MGLFSPVVREYLRPVALLARGPLLDVGCGNKPYRDLFVNVRDYVGMELAEDVLPAGVRPCGRKIEADLFARAEAIPVPDRTFETVLATQVIEHLSDPPLFFDEAVRVLRPGGLLVLTFPLINPLHEEPHDYYRFTHYAVRHLCESRRMVVEQETKMGGGWLAVGYLVRHFLGAKESAGSTSASARLRALTGRLLYRGLSWADRFDPQPGAPLNYLITARKMEGVAP